MTDEQSLIALLIFVAVCLAAAVVVGLIRAGKNRRSCVDKAEEPPLRPEVVKRVKEEMLRIAKHLPPIAPTPPKPKEHSPRLKHLKQNLLTKVLHNDATAARLLQFEIDEGRRKGLPEENSETLLERAIERFERDNR